MTAEEITESLVKIEDLKAFLNLTETNTTLDNFLQICIDAAILDSKHYTNQDIFSREYKLYKYGNGLKVIYLPNKPVTEITSITDQNGVEYKTDSAIFEIYGSQIIFVNGIFPNTLLKFTYKAGYIASTIPADLRQALIELSAERFLKSFQAHESRFGLTATNWNAQGGGGKSFENESQRENYFYKLFQNYRIMNI